MMVTKMLEFIYLGATNIDSEDEVSFSNLLADFEIGGDKSLERKDDISSNQLTNSGDVLIDPQSVCDNDNYIKKNKKYECGKCGLVVTDKTGLRMHMHIHKESKQFTCEVCGKGIKFILINHFPLCQSLWFVKYRFSARQSAKNSPTHSHWWKAL